MARVAINTGAAANDGTGDTLRAAGGVINNNFLEVYTYLGAGSTTTLSAPVWSTTSVGINTLRNVGIGTTNPRFTLEVGAVGASGTTLFVNGDARITGILTIGTSSITLNGATNIINIGTGVTINGSTGIISATSIVLGGATLTGAGVTSIVAGTGITISGSTGQVTITATGVGSSQFVVTSAGIHTLSNVGIGTTNPTSKLTVTGDGTFTGVVTAATFIGDGSGLTGVVGSGSGVIVRDSGTLVGTAGTIDFGDNLTVSAISAGVVTVTASSGSGSSQFVTTAAGIHTLSNVGIGTTNPTSALTVTGNGTFTGVVTATTFIGALTGTATTAAGLSGTPNITVGTISATSLNASGVVTATTFIGALTGTATTATLATNAQGLTGTPNITVGTIGATSLNVSGVSTFVGLITAGRITAGLTSSIIPFYYDTYASLPSYSTYHGAVAHAHDTGKLYYAHTRWVELVNTESDGTVGTGTEKYNIGITSVTTLNVSGVSTFAGITTVTGTTLFAKQLNVSGVITATTFIGAVTGNVTGNATGLSGTPNITVGTVGATSLNVSGVTTVGIITGATYYGDASNAVDGKWTLGASGSSHYTFTGVGFTETTNDPVLYLTRSEVYEFVNNSGGSHPFQIRTGNGGSAYNNGVTNNGAASGTIRFEVPFNAPNTLYYQCTNHSGMGATIFVTPRLEPAVGVRTTLTATTGSVGSGSTTNLNIDGFKTYGLLKVGITSAAWVVLYTDSTSRTNDETRSHLTDPTPGSGVIAEVRTTSSGVSTFIMSPGVIGWNNDVSTASTIYARVTNNESSTSTGIGVTLTVVKLED